MSNQKLEQIQIGLQKAVVLKTSHQDAIFMYKDRCKPIF